jgi:uncharacterized protein (DUF305 family)
MEPTSTPTEPTNLLRDLFGRTVLAASLATALVAVSIAVELPTRGQAAGANPHAAHVQVSSEADFVLGMIPHHQEAVDAAQIVLERSERREVRELAAAIVASQAAEIAQLRAWAAAWYPTASAPAYTPMMQSLAGLTPDEADRTFTSDMIHHHAMAIAMAEAALALPGLRDEVRVLAEAIIRAQTEEIATLRAWLAAWGRAPAHRGH